jgi:signal recognition particle subunit SRP54
MVLESLGNSLRSAFNKLVTSVTLDKKVIEEVIVDIRRSFLQSDVNVKLANELADRIRKRSLEEKTPAGMTKREHVLKIVYEELVNFLGKEFTPLKLDKKPSTILMVGLLGSGKTTSVAKLARYLQKQGYKVGIICADVYRPAGLEQLQQLGQSINVPVYGEKDEKDPIKIINNGLKEFSKKDVIIVDTAGRHKQAEELMQEMKRIYDRLKPDETILVIDGSIGQAAKVQAEAFHKVSPIGSIMITKLDGTSKGGGALSACAVTGAKVKFIGTGEKIEDLEVYNPERFVSRLLGLGDLQTLLEKAKEVEIKPEKVEKIVEGKLTLQDFYEQIEAMQKLGPLKQIASMLPGIGMKLPEEIMEMQEEKMKHFKHIIQSMTKQEKENPEIIDSSRIKRIAKGSGRPESEVRELLNQYEKMKKVMKSLGGMKGLQRGALKNLAKQFGFKL